MPAEPIPLLLPGTRQGPRPDALGTAEQLASWWKEARAPLEIELFAHYTAYRDAVAANEIPADEAESIPELRDPSAVWPHVALSSVHVAPYGRANEAQVALRVPWDEEHTLGALLRDGGLVELNGSILEPR